MTTNRFLITLTIILAAIMTLTLHSCKNNTQLSKDEIVMDSLVFKDKVYLLEQVDTLLPYADVNINFKYPAKFRDKESLIRLQQIVTGTFFNNIYLGELPPKEAFDAYIEEYSEEYKSLTNDYYNDKSHLGDGSIPNWYWYSRYMKNNVMFNDSKLLSISAEQYDYTGGAHGSFVVLYTNIDLDELVTISEEDIFKPNYQKPLAEIIVNRLMTEHKVDTREGLLEIGFFDINEIFPNNNFWISDKGIHYAFNQYEIAPYVMGVIDVFIPYEDLNELLNSGTVIKHLLEEKE